MILSGSYVITIFDAGEKGFILPSQVRRELSSLSGSY